MALAHPDADIRPWLQARPDEGDPYTRARIAQSYDFVDGVLAPLPATKRGLALDVGCGTAFDDFALAAHYDRVVALDANLRRVRAGRRLARRAGIERIEIRRANAESFHRDHDCDLVYCNIVSDLTRSRKAVIARLTESAADDGAIFYGEACEGYAPRDLARAVAERDGAELRVRLRQIVNGFCGNPAFRFFVGGSAAAVFERQGFGVVHSRQELWHGLVCAEQLWLQRDGEARAPAGDDADYETLDPDFAAVRELFAGAARSGSVAPDAIDPANRFAPFVDLLRMALLVPEAHPANAPWVLARLRDKVPRVLTPAEPDWDAMQELFARFEAALPAG